MKSFIPWQLKIKEETVTIRLDCEVIDDLKGYAEYLESSQNYVVCQVLRRRFGRTRILPHDELSGLQRTESRRPSRRELVARDGASPKRETTVA